LFEKLRVVISNMKIAVLEDDLAQAAFVCLTLSAAGHVCHSFTDGCTIVRRLERETFDLMVLDWNVPKLSGEEVLRWVRRNLSQRLPVLFMTVRDRESDISAMLNEGADDYVVKPVSSEVLLARVGALLRRAYSVALSAAADVFGEFEFRPDSGQVFVRGRPVILTQKEFALALLLFRSLGQPLSRAYIAEAVWRRNPEVLSRTMDTHISALRAKLGLRPESGYRVTPLYGYGYRLDRVQGQAGNGAAPVAGDDGCAAGD
jgi:DNA-binding response OmpR family regulator